MTGAGRTCRTNPHRIPSDPERSPDLLIGQWRRMARSGHRATAIAAVLAQCSRIRFPRPEDGTEHRDPGIEHHETNDGCDRGMQDCSHVRLRILACIKSERTHINSIRFRGRKNSGTRRAREPGQIQCRLAQPVPRQPGAPVSPAQRCLQ